MVEVDGDIFSCILTHIFDWKTLHNVLVALPKAHRLFPIALRRLWQLPVYLDLYAPRSSAASQQVLNYLLDPNPGPAESIRHLVISVEHPHLYDHIRPPGRGRGRGFNSNLPRNASDARALQDRLPDLFRRTVNLESLDYHSLPGIDLKSTHFEALQNSKRLTRFGIDQCALRNRERDVPAAAGPGEVGRWDAEVWQIAPFLSTVGPAITSLDLRHVNHTMFTQLLSHIDVFASYHALEHLNIDITEGVWDWHGGGSPAMGASASFIFPCLQFPSITHFELVVADKTVSGARRGPLKLVRLSLLTELTIDVRYSIWWLAHDQIHLFEALSAQDLPALRHLEIRDNTRNKDRHYWDPADNSSNWRHPGRTYFGLVPSFLAGALPNLASLWVDEKVLLFPHQCTVQALLADAAERDPDTDTAPYILWRDTLRTVFPQLESLRVGFGAITDADAGLILSLCDSTKLTQFGFEWDWLEYGRDAPLSPALLTHLPRFPNLTDVHILFPRPGTHVSGLPDPVVDARTLGDVSSMFRCNGHISRVGIGNSVVWERGGGAILDDEAEERNEEGVEEVSSASLNSQHPAPSDALPSILLVSDGSNPWNPAMPKFFHAGFMPNRECQGIYYNSNADDSDNAVPPRPERGEEIERLRDLLERIIR